MLQQNVINENDFQELPPRVSTFQYFRKVFFSRGVVIFGFAVVTLMIITAIFAPLLAPYDPYEQDLDNSLASPSWKHLLGTDTVGRDTLSRIIYGSRASLIVGIVALSVAAGLTHATIMRFIDALMTVPMILLALTIAAVLGGGLTNIIIALGIALIPTYARLMCGQALAIKQNDYITAARSIGASDLKIMIKHIAPNCFPPLIVMMTMQIGITILAEAGLSFLGIGISPPGAAWGAMVSEGYRYLTVSPILSFAPGLAIMLVVFAFNMIGDGLRDALDPRLRGTL
jgi:peptide/nickel transport system permease protein